MGVRGAIHRVAFCSPPKQLRWAKNSRDGQVPIWRLYLYRGPTQVGEEFRVKTLCPINAGAENRKIGLKMQIEHDSWVDLTRQSPGTILTAHRDSSQASFGEIDQTFLGSQGGSATSSGQISIPSQSRPRVLPPVPHHRRHDGAVSCLTTHARSHRIDPISTTSTGQPASSWLRAYAAFIYYSTAVHLAFHSFRLHTSRQAP